MAAKVKGRGELLEMWLKRMPKEQRAEVESIAEVLIDDVTTKICGERTGRGGRVFGRGMALEVIWAVGRYLNEPVARRLGEEVGGMPMDR